MGHSHKNILSWCYLQKMENGHQLFEKAATVIYSWLKQTTVSVWRMRVGLALTEPASVHMLIQLFTTAPININMYMHSICTYDLSLCKMQRSWLCKDWWWTYNLYVDNNLVNLWRSRFGLTNAFWPPPSKDYHLLLTSQQSYYVAMDGHGERNRTISLPCSKYLKKTIVQ